MSVEDPALKGSKHRRPNLLHIAGQEHQIGTGLEQGISHCDVKCLSAQVCGRRQMQSANTGLMSSSERSRSAVVTDYHDHASRYPAARARIDDTLECCALM